MSLEELFDLREPLVHGRAAKLHKAVASAEVEGQGIADLWRYEHVRGAAAGEGEVPVNVPLLEIPMRLIKKYEPLRKGNLVFPVYSNQKSNDYLKEIAALCDIHKDVTFHVARHTFATTITLENGVPIESVSKMLGHTNVQTTQIYARITERKINQDMDVLSKKLDPQAGVYIMPESEYRARKAKKLRKELQEFALANGVSMMN